MILCGPDQRVRYERGRIVDQETLSKRDVRFVLMEIGVVAQVGALEELAHPRGQAEYACLAHEYIWIP